MTQGFTSYLLRRVADPRKMILIKSPKIQDAGPYERGETRKPCKMFGQRSLAWFTVNSSPIYWQRIHALTRSGLLNQRCMQTAHSMVGFPRVYSCEY
jgi:hypothetical protein